MPRRIIQSQCFAKILMVHLVCWIQQTLERLKTSKRDPKGCKKISKHKTLKKTPPLMPRTLLKWSTQTSLKTTPTHTEKKNLPRQRQSEDDQGAPQAKSEITSMGNACRNDWSEKWRIFLFLRGKLRFFPLKRRSFRWRSFIGFDHQTWWITSQMVADWCHLTWTLGCPGEANVSKGN